MDTAKLLRAVYESIDWDRLYELCPEADRAELDGLFRSIIASLTEQIAPPDQSFAPSVSNTDAIAGGDAILYTDGASKGNPGPAGVGMVLCAPDGAEVLAWGASIGRATNNVAEYRAVMTGLTKALELGVRRITLLSDSELLIRQLEGRYRVKNAGLKPLHAEVKELLARFESWKARHVGREKNAHADELASAHAKRK